MLFTVHRPQDALHSITITSQYIAVDLYPIDSVKPVHRTGSE